MANYLGLINCLRGLKTVKLHANHGGTDKSPKILNAAENKFDTVICYQMEKTSRKTKTPPSDFKATTPKNTLINNQTITSIRILTTTLAYPKKQTCS